MRESIQCGGDVRGCPWLSLRGIDLFFRLTEAGGKCNKRRIVAIGNKLRGLLCAVGLDHTHWVQEIELFIYSFKDMFSPLCSTVYNIKLCRHMTD